MKKKLSLRLAFWHLWKASIKTHQGIFKFNSMTLCILPKVKKRARESLNFAFSVSVQFPSASRHQRGPSIQLLMSEEYLCSKRNGTNQTDIQTFYQKTCFGPGLLLSEKFFLDMTLFNLLTFLKSLAYNKWLNCAQYSLNTRSEGCFLVLKWYN